MFRMTLLHKERKGCVQLALNCNDLKWRYRPDRLNDDRCERFHSYQMMIDRVGHQIVLQYGDTNEERTINETLCKGTNARGECLHWG